MSKALADVGMVFGQTVGYVFQYKDIHETQSAAGFSPMVCLVLIVANALRIVFWVGKRFDPVLLVQSVVMILAQLVLMELCVRVTYQPEAKKAGGPTLMARARSMQQAVNSGGLSLDSARAWLRDYMREFWAWDNFGYYVLFVVSFFLTVLIVAATINSILLYEIIGLVALGTEACLAVPQLLKNHKRKSTEGCSYALVATWVIGDLFKTSYFFILGSPFQFLLCGCIQLTIDFLICAQIYLYRNSTPLPTAQDSASSPGIQTTAFTDPATCPPATPSKLAASLGAMTRGLSFGSPRKPQGLGHPSDREQLLHSEEDSVLDRDANSEAPTSSGDVIDAACPPTSTYNSRDVFGSGSMEGDTPTGVHHTHTHHSLHNSRHYGSAGR